MASLLSLVCSDNDQAAITSNHKVRMATYSSSSSSPSFSSDTKSEVEVKVLTWNVKGVLYENKEKSKLDRIENISQYDVMGVTETHLSKEDRNRFELRYEGDYEVYHTTPEYDMRNFIHGVALLIHKNSILASGRLLKEEHWDKEGRVLVYETKSYGLIVVAYLPTPNLKRCKMRKEYDESFYKFLVDNEDRLLAVMGDFNMALNDYDKALNKDHKPIDFGRRYREAANRENEMIEKCHLFDAFRETFQKNRVYTSYQEHFYREKGEEKVGRVDYIFLNKKYNLKGRYSLEVLGPAFERDGSGKFNKECMGSDHRPLVSSMTGIEIVLASSDPVEGSDASVHKRGRLERFGFSIKKAKTF